MSLETNRIANCLSRRPSWLVGKDRSSDCNQDPNGGGVIGFSRDELCLRVITEARHLLRENPALSSLEEVGQKDPDNKMMIEYIRTNRNFKGLSPF